MTCKAIPRELLLVLFSNVFYNWGDWLLRMNAYTGGWVLWSSLNAPIKTSKEVFYTKLLAGTAQQVCQSCKFNKFNQSLLALSSSSELNPMKLTRPCQVTIWMCELKALQNRRCNAVVWWHHLLRYLLMVQLARLMITTNLNGLSCLTFE
jgi:hypothetical protein